MATKINAAAEFVKPQKQELLRKMVACKVGSKEYRRLQMKLKYHYNTGIRKEGKARSWRKQVPDRQDLLDTMKNNEKGSKEYRRAYHRYKYFYQGRRELILKKYHEDRIAQSNNRLEKERRHIEMENEEITRSIFTQLFEIVKITHVPVAV